MKDIPNYDPSLSGIAELENFGVLGGEGIGSLESVHTQSDREGRKIYCGCPNCGSPQELTLLWEEILMMANQKAPRGFSVQHGRFVPSGYKCPKCPRELAVSFSFDECKRWLSDAVERNLISRAELQQRAQRIGLL